MKTANFELVRTMQQKGMTLAIAESMTCGLMAHQLCNAKGTSKVLKGSLVCYQPEVKTELCKVPAAMLKRFTAESQEVTDALAKNLAKIIVADVHLAVTGLAAPGGSEGPGKTGGHRISCGLLPQIPAPLADNLQGNAAGDPKTSPRCCLPVGG